MFQLRSRPVPRWSRRAMHALALLVGATGIGGCSATGGHEAEMRGELAKYNVVWDTPSRDASGSMPIGNGVLGANVWVEEGGDLLLYLARTDSWSENERLLKLGRVRISLTPNPFTKGSAFKQELVLPEGRIDITAGTAAAVRLSLWIDSDDPVLHISGDTGPDTRCTVTIENWRTSRRRLADPEELNSTWAMRGAPADLEIWESGDVFVEDGTATDTLCWYHRNEHSIVPMTLARQGLSSVSDTFGDPLLNRTFGARVRGRGLARTSDHVLEGKAGRLDLAITTDSSQTDTAQEWVARVRELSGQVRSADDSRAHTARWWREFWDRSWIFVDGDPGPDALPTNSHPLRIGCDSNGQNVFRGDIGAGPVFCYDVLSDSEVGGLAAVKPADYPHLLAGHSGINVKSWEAGQVDRIPWFEDVGNVYHDKQGFVTHFAGGHLELKGPAMPVLGSFTAAAWIKPAADIGPARIFDKGTAGGSDGFLFDTHPGNSLRLICGRRSISADNVLKKGRWQHVAASFDGATGAMRIYLDGAPVAQSEHDGPALADGLSTVTRGYILQRWMLACESRGEFPPKFNGSMFTVEPRFINGKPFDPDWRAWGGSFWWQNTRLPYYPMLAAGDYDLMQPLFDFYSRGLEACKARAELYYHAQGIYFPETMTMFYTYANGDYGWNREGLSPGDISSPWWRWAWNQSLELTQLMLDYYEHTGDEQFLRERALPMAEQTLAYFRSRFQPVGPCIMGEDEQGHKVDPSDRWWRTHQRTLEISPTQAIETYWKDVVNDAPCVAGLRAITEQLLRLPANLTTGSDRRQWSELRGMCPPLPLETKDGVLLAAPAEKYNPERSNCETPELYPVFPFRQAGIGRPGIEPAIEAYRRRHDKASVGWTQDGAFAAMLGLTDEARSQLIARARNSHPTFRFPAMWGPNFDWLPDQCHGGNLNLLLQLMLVQPVGDTVYLLPAWPADWSARFRLHAPGKTVIEGRVKDGELVELKVWPSSRKKDIIVREHGEPIPLLPDVPILVENED